MTCKTPGARYRIKIGSQYISCAVELPIQMRLVTLNDHLIHKDRKSTSQVYENIIHDAMEEAIARIAQMDANGQGPSK